MPTRAVYSVFTATATVGRWIPLDVYAVPFNTSIAVVLGSAASGSYRVEHTFDDVLQTPTATAFVHPDLSANSTNADGNYAYPVAATRLVVTSAASAMTVRMYVTQSG